MTRAPFHRALLFYGGHAVVCGLLLAWLVPFGEWPLRIPFSYSGDGLIFSALVKAVAEDGPLHAQRIGAPFGSDLVDWPLGMWLPLGITTGLVALFDDAGIAINLYWLLSLVLAGVTATWSLVRLSLPRGLAFVTGMLYAFLPFVDMTGIDEFLEGWERRLLLAAGLDWERFALGAVLAGEVRFASDLGERGSEGAARLLLRALDLPRPYPYGMRVGDAGEVLAALGAFVSSQGPCPRYTTTRSDDVLRAPDAPVVLADLEERVLDALAERTSARAGRQEAEAASHILLRLCRPESLEAYEQMRQSPFFEVRERGTIGLRALGEAVPDARPAPPVEFRLILDERPLPATPLETTLVSDAGGMQITTTTTNTEGVLLLERDRFLDPRAPVRAVILSFGRSPEEARFSVSLPPPEDLGAPATVRVRTGVLRLTIPGWVLERRDETEELTLFMRRVNEDEDPGVHSPFGWHVTVLESPVTFPRLQHGTYMVRLVLSDGTVLESPEVTVSERPVAAELVDATPDYSFLELGEP